MVLINITPVMTSNTTPAPYITSAGSTYNDTRQPYYAFDEENSGTDSWVTMNKVKDEWIQIDFGKEAIAQALSIQIREMNSNNVFNPNEAPKHLLYMELMI